MPAPHHSVFLQAGCPSCRPTNSVKELKALAPVNPDWFYLSDTGYPGSPGQRAHTLEITNLSIPSVGLSVRKVYCGKTAQWVPMLFGMVSGVGRGMGVLFSFSMNKVDY